MSSPVSSLALLLDRLQPVVPAPEVTEPACDPAAIRAEAFAAGEAAGRAAAEAALLPLHADLEAAAAAFRNAAVIDGAALRPLLAALVRAVAEAVLASELAMRDDALLALAQAAFAAVMPDEAPLLTAHPDTLARLGPHLPPVAIRPDSGMPAGAVCVSGPTFRIDADIATRLAQSLEGLA